MKESNNNKKGPNSDFERYVRGEMSRREENAFQRKLQLDPFSDEAAEGYSEITPKEADDDLKHLGKQLKSRITPGQKIVFYRIAASLAVLVVITAVYFLVFKNRSGQRISNITVTTTQEENGTDSRRSAEPLLAESNGITADIERESDGQITNDITEPEIPAEAENIAIPDASVTDQVSKQPENITEAVPAALNEAAMTRNTATESARANITDTASKAENVPTAYSPPLPVNGNERFRQYIQDNQRKPPAFNDGEQVVVVVSFKVLSSGIIDSIKALESPGDEYSQEAIRLIREGPSWSPAENNGEKTDDEVSLRIVFR